MVLCTITYYYFVSYKKIFKLLSIKSSNTKIQNLKLYSYLIFTYLNSLTSVSFQAVDNVNNIIAPELVKAACDPIEQEKIDEMMLKLDGTDNKNKLGANAILGVSMAVCKAGAAHKGKIRLKILGSF